jgi:long-chain acyl-CoA synthetase
VALAVPLFHCYGQNAVMNAAFHAGACVVLAERFDAAMLAEQAARRDVSVVFGVPEMFSRLLDLGATAAREIGALRYVLSAASTMPPSLAARWREETGLPMHEAYGLTESSPFAAYNHAAGHQPGTLGAAVAGVRMAVVDPESDAPCAPGERGEIVIRGHNVMLGYWNRPEETARALRGGWLHTGDMGYADEQGRFHLVDRAADLAKVAGFRVYPATVEAVLREHGTVADVAAYGVTDAARGERLEAAVVLSSAPDGEASDAAADELRRHCAARLASYEVPSRVHVCRELPRSATGKISRPALRAASSHPLGLQHALDARASLTS